MDDLCQSPHLAGKQMSSSLKERLKRSARHAASPMGSPLTSKKVSQPCFTVPSSPVSRSCTSGIDNTSIMNENTSSPSKTPSTLSAPSSLEEIQSCDDKDKLHKMLSSLSAVKTRQEEKLRKLKMVQVYHSKHHPAKFEKLIQKWKLTVQEAIKKFYEILPEPKPELTELINHLQIDHELIGYNKEDESFL